MSLDSLEDAFYDELCDVYHAEKQLVKALPKMVKKASNATLAAAFKAHLAETEEHVARCEQAFEDTGKVPKAKKCDAMAGLIEEAKSMMEEDAEPEVMDAILIGCAQKVEHYEIAGYGSLVALARQLGHEDVASLLAETLAEEQETDQKLNQIALSLVNPQAAEDADEAGSGQGARKRVRARASA